MTRARPRILAALSLALATASATPAFAYDKLGTAGPIRVAGDIVCLNGDTTDRCTVPAVDPALPPAQKLTARLDRARRLVGVMHMSEAIAELDTALVEQPGAPAALLMRGRLKLSRGDAGGARADIDAILARGAANADALATRAFLLRGEDDRLALQDANAAIALAPRNVDARIIRAFVLVGSGKPAEAEQDLSVALEEEPDNSVALVRRAQLRMQNGDIAAALRDVDAAMAIRPDIQALQIRAVAYVKEGNYVKALPDLDAILGPVGQAGKTVPLNIQFIDIIVQRILVLARLGCREDAKTELATILDKGGQRPVLQLQLYLRSHGFPDAALDGKPSEQLSDDVVACFLNDACGRGVSIRM